MCLKKLGTGRKFQNLGFDMQATQEHNVKDHVITLSEDSEALAIPLNWGLCSFYSGVQCCSAEIKLFNRGLSSVIAL